MTFRGCYDGANQFIERHFFDCIYSTQDFVGFCMGMLSISFWVVAQVPQFISNIKNQSAEALSPWFLAQWLLGDTCNLLGCLLQGQQLPTTTYTAMYFVLSDMVMMVQYIYYGAVQKRRERLLRLKARRHRHHRHHQPSNQTNGASSSRRPDEEQGAPLLEAYALPSGSSSSGIRTAQIATAAASLATVGILSLSSVGRLAGQASSRALLQGGGQEASMSAYRSRLHSEQTGDLVALAGTILGWISAVLYIMARCSQILKNQQRRSAEGLSPIMFACAVMANLLSGIAMFLRADGLGDIATQGPWLVGTLGTVFLDIFILTQAFRYGIKAKAPEEGAAGQLEAPLLDAS